MMKPLSRTVLLMSIAAGVLVVTPLSAHADGGDTCTRAVDRATTLYMELARNTAKGMEGGGKTMLTEAKAEVARARPQALARCRRAVKKDRKLAKTLDCMVAAKDYDAMFRCQGAGRVLTADKCTRAVDRGLELALELNLKLMKERGEGGEKKPAEVKAEIDKSRPQAIKDCRAALAKDRALENTLDCMIAARDMAALSACGSKKTAQVGDKCTLAINQAMEFAMMMVEQMLATAGGDTKKKLAEAKAVMETSKPGAIDQCRTALAKDPKLEKTLDCMIAARDVEAMSLCEGAEVLMGE